MILSNEIPGDRSFRIFVAIAAITSLPLAAGNLVTMMIALHANFDALADPTQLLKVGPFGARFWRWSMILDLFGYYLLIIPLILYLRSSLRFLNPNWVDLSALCLLAYCFIGAIGAAVLFAATPPLIDAYAIARGPQAVIVETLSGVLSDSVYRGLWNLLEEFLAGIGWVGLGLALRPHRRHLALMTLLLGAASLTDSAGSALRCEALSMVGLAAYLVLAPIWACWTGADLLVHPPCAAKS